MSSNSTSACRPGFSNVDELRLGDIEDCHVSDSFVRNVYLFDVILLYSLALTAIKKGFPLLRDRSFKLGYIPHAILLCYGLFGSNGGTLYLYKYVTFSKVSNLDSIELILHAICPMAFFPGSWLFVFSLMTASSASEMGGKAADLRRKFWAQCRFFMILELLYYPLPFLTCIIWPELLPLASIFMICSMINLGITIGVSTGLFARAIDRVLTSVIAAERLKAAAAAAKATVSKSSTPSDIEQGGNLVGSFNAVVKAAVEAAKLPPGIDARASAENRNTSDELLKNNERPDSGLLPTVHLTSISTAVAPKKPVEVSKHDAPGGLKIPSARDSLPLLRSSSKIWITPRRVTITPSPAAKLEASRRVIR